MTTIDTNVSNYTLSELMTIVELDDLDPENIVEQTNYYIRKYKNKNPALSVFFKDVQSQLLQYAQGLEYESDEDNNEDNNEDKIIVNPSEKIKEGFGNMSNDAVYPAGDKQITEWYENQVLTQSDTNQTDKITQRKQKIQTFGNQHLPMKRDQIATTDTFNLPVKQDSLNPNLKNSINRFINLDSQFRQYTNGADSQSTSYTCDLSDTLKNVLKLSLYSYQIPFSWYAIDEAYGNTCFWISDPNSEYIVPISVPAGNYSQTDFQTTLTSAFLSAGFGGFTLPPNAPAGATAPVYFNPNNGKITLYLENGYYNPSGGGPPYLFTISSTTQLIFYDFTGVLRCNINCSSKSDHYFNNSLGWIMGYRVPYINVISTGNSAPTILDLTGTKYLILVIDDYNQNHVNNSLVSISQFSNNLKMPTYYSTDIPYTCITPAQQGNNLSQLLAESTEQTLFDFQTTNVVNGLLIAGKYQQDYTSTQFVLPSAPRTLTSAQLYTINSINNNNNNLTNYLAKAPTSSEILAILPVKTSVGMETGTLLVEFSGSLQDSERTYFGPVNIERLAVKLLDDKGNILNLNGNDWCVSLIAECLYQY